MDHSGTSAKETKLMEHSGTSVKDMQQMKSSNNIFGHGFARVKFSLHPSTAGVTSMLASGHPSSFNGGNCILIIQSVP